MFLVLMLSEPVQQNAERVTRDDEFSLKLWAADNALKVIAIFAQLPPRLLKDSIIDKSMYSRFLY